MIRPWLSLVFGCVLLTGAAAAASPDLSETRRALLTGQYDDTVATAQAALRDKEDSEEWSLLLIDALLAKGRYPEALTAATNALASEPRSLRLRWSAREAFLRNGRTLPAARMATEIQQLFTTRNWLYREPKDLIVFGRVALLGGMDPKLVLDRLYDRVKKVEPKLRDVYLASGELALEKHDLALAAKLFQEGLKQLPDDPDLHFGLANAYAPSDPQRMLAELTRALELNGSHVRSLLLLADHSIDAEDYAAAGRFLDRVEKVNPWEPDAWAYRAVIAHLKNQLEAETKARETALKFWPENPRVDYLIGQKLSQKYRFAVGASHQNRALGFDASYLPAKSQLAQDLLRLGEEADGWRLAREVQQEDSYDVTANNLMALHDVLATFQTLTNEHFALRMETNEASLYGRRALELLDRAQARLGPKYGVRLAKPTLVEIFKDEKDFAVRTFGMPDNDGFLGVCFGEVITANSPGSRAGRPFNWQSMLWHEFCHVVTLQLTHNKMPRWLSEGISVYEERQADPAWGERINPHYREMLLSDGLTPLSRLSGAFLAPKSPVHLQFAYYESSLAVQFIVERYGQDKLLLVLHDLGEGTEINDALSKHTAPMAQLEPEFKEYAQGVAKAMAPGLDWEKPEGGQLEPPKGGTPNGIVRRLPGPPEGGAPNFWVLSFQADSMLQQQKWSEARPLLEELVALYPEATGKDSAASKLAATCRALGETNAERQVLICLAEVDGDATEVYSRLMELGATAEDWPGVLTNASRYLAVNPLVPMPYRFLAQASEACGETRQAIEAYQTLLQLDPPNPAEVHYHLAKLLHQSGDPAARRHLLQALEEAPRYREALRLFRQMEEESQKSEVRSQRSGVLSPVSGRYLCRTSAPENAELRTERYHVCHAEVDTAPDGALARSSGARFLQRWAPSGAERVALSNRFAEVTNLN